MNASIASNLLANVRPELVAMLAAKAPLAVAGAVPMIFESSPAGEGSERDRLQETDPGPFAGQDFIPAPEVEETSTEQMSRIATQDAGFVQRNREPEANPAANQGFAPQP